MHDSSAAHDGVPAHAVASVSQFVATHVAHVPCPYVNPPSAPESGNGAMGPCGGSFPMPTS
jgi:hypothetical protein